MFGVSDEKPDRKASREYIYQSREQQTPSDIFGLRAPNERRSLGFLRWSDRFIYPPIKKSEQSQYGQSEKDPRIQSIDRMPSAESRLTVQSLLNLCQNRKNPFPGLK